MSFLNPILLAGLAAVSVPIIIHLLNRRKFQKVVWAAMRFVRVSVEQNQRRLQWEDIILLALRCLLVLLLALTLARPVASRLARTLFGSPVTAVFILDNSYSMGMSDGTSTRFEKAKSVAVQSLETMPAGSAVAILLASDIVQPVIPEPTFDLGLVRRVLRDAALTDRGTDLAPALSRAIDTLQRRLLLRGEVYIFTDGQSSGWRGLHQMLRSIEQVRDKIRVHILLASNHEEQNVGVSDLALGSGLVPVKQPIRCKARVTNYGKQDVRELRVSLNIDAEPPSDEFVIDLLPAGESREVTFFARLRTDGFHAVTARSNGDRLPADDRRTIVVRALREVRVLLVDGEPSTEPRDGETFYLRQALQPVSPEEARDYFIKPAVIAAGELTGVRLDDYQAVVLANVGEFSEATAHNLEGYVRRGGGVAIFAGGRLNSRFYNEVLSGKLNLLPATFGAARGQADQETNFFSLQDRDYEHPIVSIWNDPASGTLASARFYRAFDLTPVPFSPPPTNRAAGAGAGAAGEPQVILRFADGKPAALERDFGLGRVAVFASTADTAWNDLPVRLPFVPLLHRLLGALVQRQDEDLNVSVGGKFTRSVSSEWLGQEAVVTGPGTGDKVMHETRRIEMVNDSPAIQSAETDLAGLYEVSVSGAEPASALRFAAQSDPAESLLDELSADQKKMLSGAAHLIEWGLTFSWKREVERERRGAEFWLPLLVAALLVALLEMTLAQWFSRSR
jgi:hypothetical protein